MAKESDQVQAPNKDKGSKSRPNLQAIYKPPFSIKLEFTRKSNASNDNHGANEGKATNGVTKDSKSKTQKSKAQATKSTSKAVSKPPKDSSSFRATAAPASSASSKCKAVTSSLLRRRKANSRSGPKSSAGRSGELQILIPNNLEDDETLTPTTPATS